MFSSLHHYAPSHYHFRQQKIPEDIGLDRRTFYKGYPVVGGVAIVSSGGGGGGEGGRYSSSHFDDFNSSHHITRIIEIDSQVDGSNRYKYFRRPIIPYMPSLGGQVVFARKPVPAGVGVGQLQQQQYQQHMNNEPMTRTIAIQTMYR